MFRSLSFIPKMSVNTVSEGTNYTAVDIGKLSDLSQHVLTAPDGVTKIPGKIFLSPSTKMTGSEISYGLLPPGQGSPFFHAHHKHEEVYLIISGNGEYQCDNTVFPIQEGSIVRVGTGVSRALKNTGSSPMVYICVQTTEGSYQANIPNEYDITKTVPKFH